LTLIGGIPTDYFIPDSASREDLINYLQYMQDVTASGVQFIPGITDAFSPLGDFDRLRMARDFFAG
jgi:hypothetical protein